MEPNLNFRNVAAALRRSVLVWCAAFLLLCIAPWNSAAAQFKLSDVPLITKEDFQAPVPRKVKYWILIQSAVSYQIDSAAREGDRYRVWVSMKVEMQRDKSYWNHKKVKPKYDAQLLLHEQGHFYVSHIVANRLQQLIQTQLYSENYEQEVRNMFSEIHPKLYHQFSNYDKDTRHGMDENKQKEWTYWLRRQFK